MEPIDSNIEQSSGIKCQSNGPSKLYLEHTTLDLNQSIPAKRKSNEPSEIYESEHKVRR